VVFLKPFVHLTEELTVPSPSNPQLLVFPSLLAANHNSSDALAADMRSVSLCCEGLHYDVMNGGPHGDFVVGSSPINHETVALGRETVPQLTRDVHLMVQRPGMDMFQLYYSGGAQWLTVHLEAYPDLGARVEALQSIRSLGMKPGIALNPDTDLTDLLPILERGGCEMVLLMSVVPGKGGQGFIPSCLDKIRELGDFIRERGLPVTIGVDGGINADTARKCIAAAGEGVTVMLVAGAYIFGKPQAEDRVNAAQSLRPSHDRTPQASPDDSPWKNAVLPA
jgi:ribulose-phosphate 3-epimerase